MTAEEAIKTIQVAIAEVEWEYPLDYSIAFETAIEALEKQIPKKPINEECYYICPRCRDDLGVSDDDIFIYELSMPKYCSNCGCKLDWTEVKNEV
ncbi:MAG: hypothetical protein KIG40_06030 [Bacteroidaceae bacterium]|nr:hypothetical protein [Bacteroidaceae bacterium]